MMSRREFTYLSPDQIAGEVIAMVAAVFARRFPTLSPLDLDILLAGIRDEIEAGLDEFVCGIVEASKYREASDDE
jgi:hypothetical protein